MPRQRGYTLLVILLILILVGAQVFLLSANSSGDRFRRDAQTSAAMAKAKVALIGWSAAHATQPGFLPCPENLSLIGAATEGQALSSCSSPTGITVGRLAWRTLGLDPDASGERLWYALSTDFRSAPINSDWPGSRPSAHPMTLDGHPEPIIALIIDPGPALPGQSRNVPTSSTPPNVNDYLDGANRDGDSAFTAIPVPDVVNDRVLAIYPSDLFPVLEKRVANEAKVALLEYFCGVGNVGDDGSCALPGGSRYFPRPANFADMSCLGTGALPSCSSAASGNVGRIPSEPDPANVSTSWDASSLVRGNTLTWFQANGWREMVYYAVAPACIDGTSNCNGPGGYLSVRRPGSNPVTNLRAVVVVAGRNLLADGPRTNKTDLASYFEDINAVPGNNLFTQWPTSSGTPFNDIVIAIP